MLAFRHKQALTNSFARAYFSTAPRSSPNDFFLETQEVQDLIDSGSDECRFINASFYPRMDCHAMHREARLTETTQYFSIAEIVDPASPLPNMMPSVG